MPAGIFDLTVATSRPIEAYHTSSYVVYLVDLAGDPLDLGAFDPAVTTGALGMYAQFRALAESADPAVFTLKDPGNGGAQFPGNGIVIASPSTQGKITITFAGPGSGTATQGATPPVIAGVWDMVGVGKIAVAKDWLPRLLQGSWNISKGVTRGI